MTRTAPAIVVTLLAASLAACSKPAETPQNSSPEPMPGMSMPAQTRAGQAKGVVTAIDMAAGKIEVAGLVCTVIGNG